MSHPWVRAANAIGNYRWDGLPAPTDTAWDATVNRQRHRLLGNAGIYGGLIVATRLAWMVWG